MPVLETPRPIENSGEEHLPCAVLVDTSQSMAPYSSDLPQALQQLSDAINDDDTARGRVELCLITFDDSVHILQPFGPMSSFEVPRTISCGGMTSTHKAIAAAIQEVNRRKAEYKANSVCYRQPWIWLFTDGCSNDADNGAYDELLRLQDKRLSFYGVGIGPDADASELKSMNKNNFMLRVSRENFRKAFEFLSASLSQASSAMPGQSTTITLPTQMVLET